MKNLKKTMFMILFLGFFSVNSYAIPPRPMFIEDQWVPLTNFPMVYIVSAIVLVFVIISFIILKKCEKKYIKDILLYFVRVSIIYFCVMAYWILTNTHYYIEDTLFDIIILKVIIPSIIIEFIVFGVYIRIREFVKDIKSIKNNN